MKGGRGTFLEKGPPSPLQTSPFPLPRLLALSNPSCPVGGGFVVYLCPAYHWERSVLVFEFFYYIGITCNLKKYSKVGALWERESGWKGGFLKAGLGFRNILMQGGVHADTDGYTG